jgi:hypothetical protein
VRDIIDVINDVKDFDQVEWIRNKNNVGSIAKRTSNLVLVFPVICSTSISIKTASIITKAIERKCVSLLQILFSSMQLTSVDNMYDYLRQFHTNLDLRSGLTLDDFMLVMDKMVNEGVVEVTDMDLYNAVREDMNNINYYLSTELNPTSINDYRMRKDMYGESHIVKEASPNPFGKYQKDMEDIIGKAVDKAVNKDEIKRIMGTASDREFARKSKDIYYKSKEVDNQVDYFRYQLSTGEVQKANELMPTTMMVNFTTRDDKGSYYTTTGIIGIKAKLYPVDAMDICNRISSKYKDSNGLFNLVRASTREISFFRDLAFAIDKAKVDAVNMARESNNAKMFKVLERRAQRNRFSSLLKKNDASPITSLIMSQEEVEYLKKYSSVDMEKSYVTRNILENYNLMDIVIADESLEVAKFLFDDGDGIFETMAFDSLEKEAKDSSYKKVVNLMSKLNR